MRIEETKSLAVKKKREARIGVGGVLGIEAIKFIMCSE